MGTYNMRFAVLLGACASCLAPVSPALAEEHAVAADPQDLSQLSIEQLAQIEVRSASKRAEPLSAAPAALYVITPEQIKTSGATSLPEALRLAPNLNVQQLDASDPLAVERFAPR